MRHFRPFPIIIASRNTVSVLEKRSSTLDENSSWNSVARQPGLDDYRRLSDNAIPSSKRGGCSKVAVELLHGAISNRTDFQGNFLSIEKNSFIFFFFHLLVIFYLCEMEKNKSFLAINEFHVRKRVILSIYIIIFKNIYKWKISKWEL